MEQKDARTIQRELARPFAPEDLEWRLQKTLEDKLRGIAVGWGILRQPLILDHAQTGFCYLVLMQQIFEAKYQPGDREMGVLRPKIGEVRVQFRIPDVVIGPL